MSKARAPKSFAEKALQLGLVLVTVAVVTVSTVSVVGTFTASPADSEAGPVWEELSSGNPADTPWVKYDPRYVHEIEAHPAFTAINDALRAEDRDAFLAFAEGEALDTLTRWWDNSTQIGWETAFMVPQHETQLIEGTESFQVILEADLAFPQSVPVGRGHKDAGLQLLQGEAFTATVTGEGESLRFTSLKPSAGIMQETQVEWLEGDIYVARHDHVVVFGPADEQAYVDQVSEEAERAAVHPLDSLEALTGERHMAGCLVGVTENQELYESWEGDSSFETAGYAKSTYRPSSTTYVSHDIATGVGSAGSVVIMAPEDEDSSRYATFVHEFAHALHLTGEPGLSYDYRSASTEGLARFFEHYSEVRNAAVSGDTEQAIAEYGFDVLEQEIFTEGGSDDITISTFYEAAGLMYRYLHDHGADAWQFALETGRYNQLSFIEMFEEHGAQFTESDWQEWMQQQ